MIEDFAYSWKDSMSAIPHLESFVERDLRRKNKGASKEKILTRFEECKNAGRAKKKHFLWL